MSEHDAKRRKLTSDEVCAICKSKSKDKDKDKTKGATRCDSCGDVVCYKHYDSCSVDNCKNGCCSSCHTECHRCRISDLCPTHSMQCSFCTNSGCVCCVLICPKCGKLICEQHDEQHQALCDGLEKPSRLIICAYSSCCDYLDRKSKLFNRCSGDSCTIGSCPYGPLLSLQMKTEFEARILENGRVYHCHKGPLRQHFWFAFDPNDELIKKRLLNDNNLMATQERSGGYAIPLSRCKDFERHKREWFPYAPKTCSNLWRWKHFSPRGCAKCDSTTLYHPLYELFEKTDGNEGCVRWSYICSKGHVMICISRK